jgi:hypothetical protein
MSTEPKASDYIVGTTQIMISGSGSPRTTATVTTPSVGKADQPTVAFLKFEERNQRSAVLKPASVGKTDQPALNFVKSDSARRAFAVEGIRRAVGKLTIKRSWKQVLLTHASPLAIARGMQK